MLENPTFFFLQCGTTIFGASTCILRELNSRAKMGFDSKTEMLWLCASESANTLDPTLSILPSEHSCSSVVLGFQILAGFTGRTLCKKNIYLERELYVKEINVMSSISVYHLHSTWQEYLRRSGWSSVCPLKFAEQVSHVHVLGHIRQKQHIF